MAFCTCHSHIYVSSFPGGSASEESACNAGDLGSIPGLGRSPGEGNSYLLQYSGLENSMERGAWQAIYSPWGCKELDMTERLPHTHTHFTYNVLISSVQKSDPVIHIHIYYFLKNILSHYGLS